MKTSAPTERHRKITCICGETDHFTNLAILLGDTSPGNGCSEESLNSVIAWLSLVLIILAMVIFLFSILLIEIRVRRESNKLVKLWNLLSLTSFQMVTWCK